MDAKSKLFSQINHGSSSKPLCRTKKLTVLELKIGNLYCAKEVLCGYTTLEELKYASHCMENHHTMVGVLPPIILSEDEDFIILEIIPNINKGFKKKTFVKFLATDEQMGYSEYDNENEIFYDSIELFKEQQNV